MILGLDLSLTATGWATITPDGDTRTGLIPDTKGHIADRLTTWESRMFQLVFSGGQEPDHIYVEALRGTQHGAFELGMVWGMFWRAMWGGNMADRTTEINSQTLKMHATGKGGADKTLVVVEAVRRLGYEGANHNEADALWLADLGARLAGYDRPALPATHLRALGKLAKAAA